jgi:REP element-mobilizing transposase RayT
MPSPRALQIDLDSTPYYHVMARCVRRSYLCGMDELTQKNYSHRKNWIISRLKFLAQIFSIKICAYAVLSNHYHVVLFVDDTAATKWSDNDVIARWGSIFPKDTKKHSHIPSKLPLWRERLTSISWFMRCLNEPIARAANDEDDCTGRFWEGRFRSQALLDEGALLSAMAYVDLNPIRSGIAQTPEESEFTSIYERIQLMKKQLKITPKENINNLLKQPKSLLPFSNNSLNKENQNPSIDFTLSDYLELVEYTGRVTRDDKIGSIPEHLPSILNRLNFNTSGWLSIIKNLNHKFYTAIGSEIYLLNFSKNRQRTTKGLSAAKEVYLT